MNSTDAEYTDHKIFEELHYYASFYESLSNSVMSFSTKGTSAIANMDTYVYMSMRGTLESINLVLKNGNLNDGYALLRKYYDSVMINAYTNLYINQNSEIADFYVAEINDWLHGKEPLPRMSKMAKYLKSSLILSEINELIDLDQRYEGIRSRCNDNMHYNFFSLILLNDGRIHLKERSQHLEQLRRDVRDVFILNIAYILIINEYYMVSSDYLDHLEAGMEPPENSQHWVAPFIQEMVNKVLLEERPDILELLKRSTNMELD